MSHNCCLTAAPAARALPAPPASGNCVGSQRPNHWVGVAFRGNTLMTAGSWLLFECASACGVPP